MQIEDIEKANGLIKRSYILKKCNVKNKKLLDIGAGPLAIIAARDFNCQVTSIDISDEELTAARNESLKENLGQKIRFEKADATNLPYAINQFDVVISYGALHHVDLKKRKKFILEISRVAGEKIIIAELNQKGFNKFHSMDNYYKVDFNWLEKELKKVAKIKKYNGRLMSFYVGDILDKTKNKK